MLFKIEFHVRSQDMSTSHKYFTKLKESSVTEVFDTDKKKKNTFIWRSCTPLNNDKAKRDICQK